VQVGQSQFLEVGQPLPQTAQIAGEQIDIAHAAHHGLALEPQRIGLAPRIQSLQLRRAVAVHPRRAKQNLLQMVEKIVAPAVQVQEQPEQARELRPQAALKDRPVFAAGQLRLEARQQAFQADLSFSNHPGIVSHDLSHRRKGSARRPRLKQSLTACSPSR